MGRHQFDISFFTSEEFKEVEFIDNSINLLSSRWLQQIENRAATGELLRRPELNDVHKALLNSKELLQEELVELLNRDYQQFIHLSIDLQDCPAEIHKIHAALTSLLKRNRNVQNQMKHKVTEIEEKFQEKFKLMGRVQQLKNVIKVVDLVKRLKAKLSEGPEKEVDQLEQFTAEISSAPKLRARCADIRKPFATERFARMIARLRLLEKSVGHFQVVIELQPEIESLTSQVLAWMRKTLVSAIKGQNNLACQCALRSFSVLGKHSVAEEIVEFDIVRPLVQKYLEPKWFSKSADAGNSKFRDPFTNAFDSLYKSIVESCALLLRQTNDIGDFHFVLNSIWKTILEHLLEHQKDHFFPRHPPLFQLHYKETFRLIRRLQGLCREAGVELFHDEKTMAFRKKWKSLMYFQMRQTEIIKSIPFEDSYVIQFTTNDSVPYSTSLCSSVVSAVQRCWAPNVYLHSLPSKFLELNLKILTYLCDWTLAGLEIWEDKSVILPFFSDIIFLRNEFLSSEVVPAHFGIPKESLDACFAPLHKRFSDLEVLLKTKLLEQVLVECQKFLREGVGSLRSRYFLNKSKTIPSEPSQYVSYILKPLVGLENAAQKAPQLALDIRQELLQTTIDSVLEAYVVEIEELLKKIDEQTKLRKRLAKKATENDDSDSLDQIKSQLNIDVNDFCKKLESVAIDFPELSGGDLDVASLRSLEILRGHIMH